MAEPTFKIAGQEVPPGVRRRIEMPLADLYTYGPLSMPIEVIRGREEGPTVFISAAIHGDEINGIEIIHRLLRQQSALKRLRGTLICIPIVNVFGFLNQTRYLPDGRDLNRCFPGSERGSLTSRVAHLFLREIAARCDYGIDLHTAASHRNNLPHVRANLDDKDVLRVARSFDVPVLLNANTRDGSLRQAAGDLGVKVLLFEGGERLRFNEQVIRRGLSGVMNALRALDMLPARRAAAVASKTVVARHTRWLRASRGGIHRIEVELGQRVRRGDRLGVISDPFGAREEFVVCDMEGIVIGQTSLPLVNEGDALFHLARLDRGGRARVAAKTIDVPESTVPDVEPPTY
ncbi:MAG: succinylglutamate desuccinylase/aspartoacylase family protein [Gammaproteobacteria bacterium]